MNTRSVVVTSVMYHVGAKDEQPDRTGMAHFFEHLLFEGKQSLALVDTSLLSLDPIVDSLEDCVKYFSSL